LARLWPEPAWGWHPRIAIESVIVSHGQARVPTVFWGRRAARGPGVSQPKPPAPWSWWVT